jgi:hypothetical protein
MYSYAYNWLGEHPVPSFENADTLTTWRRVLLEKLTAAQLLWKFVALYGNARVFTVFTELATGHCHVTDQSTPSCHICLESVLILSAHRQQGFPSWSLLRVPTEILYAFLISSCV